MEITIVQVGKTDEKYLESGIGEYHERLRRMVKTSIVTIPDLKNRRSLPVEEQKREEALKIMSQLKSGDHVIVLDERGVGMKTETFASTLQGLMNRGARRLVFVIGGPWGVHESLLARCDMKLSLSEMTFPHQLVRLLFLEQLYRAFTVINGIPYHNE